MKRFIARRSPPRTFGLDRERFAEFTRDLFGELVGVDGDREGGIARALEERFHDACDAGAITGPPDLEPIVYALGDSVIVAVREKDLQHELPVALRQLATYSIETKYIVDPADESFEEACAALEDLLVRASALLPSFRALRRGERLLGPDGRRRPLGALLRLLASSAR